jgi:hypothetical protein
MSVIDRLFDNLARIGNDSCDLTNRNKQNIEATNYMLENYIAYNPVNNAINLATNQPNIFVQGSPAGGINGNNIVENSMLKFSEATNHRERSIYQKRLFSTVPYLGRGPANAPVESELVRGDVAQNRKSLDPNSEVTHLNYAYTPLLPAVKAIAATPSNLIEENVAAGWIKGGVPSRLLNRVEDSN